jgi:O-acetyl-ADP-ribose deacetylase (regulator of RNase III)
MSIKYVTGDLIESDCDVIGHGCNCFNNMGGGIAWQIKNKLVEAYNADFYGTTIGDRKKMGKFTKAQSKGKTVYNLYSQFRYGHDKVHVEYEFLELDICWGRGLG